MELFEEIRRAYAVGETIQGLAKKHGIHRRMVISTPRWGYPGTKRRPGQELSARAI